MRLWTQAFWDWVAPLRDRATMPRLFLGLLTVEMGFMIGGVLTFALITTVLPLELSGDELVPASDGVLVWVEIEPGQDTQAIGTLPLRTILELIGFFGLAVGTVVAGRWLHNRDFESLLGAVDWSHLRGACVIALGAGMLPVFLYDTSNLQAHQPLTILLRWAPLAIAAIAIQTGAEELFFRGYLQTQLAARFDNPLAWMVAPAAYFAALHVDLVGLLDTGKLSPNEIEYGLWAFTFGLLTADLARVTGGLMAAWGWHIGLNAVTIFGIAPAGDMSDLALYVIPEAVGAGAAAAPFDPVSLSAELLLLVITWSAIRLWLATRDDPHPA